MKRHFSSVNYLKQNTSNHPVILRESHSKICKRIFTVRQNHHFINLGTLCSSAHHGSGMVRIWKMDVPYLPQPWLLQSLLSLRWDGRSYIRNWAYLRGLAVKGWSISKIKPQPILMDFLLHQRNTFKLPSTLCKLSPLSRALQRQWRKELALHPHSPSSVVILVN